MSKAGKIHVFFGSHTVFLRLVLAYVCVFEVLNARQNLDKSDFCQGAMEESVRRDTEINTTQKEAVSHLTDTY